MVGAPLLASGDRSKCVPSGLKRGTRDDDKQCRNGPRQRAKSTSANRVNSVLCDLKSLTAFALWRKGAGPRSSRMSAPQSKQTEKLFNCRRCKRVKFANKTDGGFHRLSSALTAAGLARLDLELERLGAQSVIISTHVELNSFGERGRREPEDLASRSTSASGRTHCESCAVDQFMVMA